MDNNDILIRLRYALDIKDADMVEVFRLGGLGSLTLTNRKSIRKAREGLFFLSNLSVIFCVTSRDLL